MILEVYTNDPFQMQSQATFGAKNVVDCHLEHNKNSRFICTSVKAAYLLGIHIGKCSKKLVHTPCHQYYQPFYSVDNNYNH